MMFKVAAQTQNS